MERSVSTAPVRSPYSVDSGIRGPSRRKGSSVTPNPPRCRRTAVCWLAEQDHTCRRMYTYLRCCLSQCARHCYFCYCIIRFDLLHSLTTTHISYPPLPSPVLPPPPVLLPPPCIAHHRPPTSSKKGQTRSKSRTF